MDSTLCMRRNHYETLGLEPTASDGEVRESFARAMRLPHHPAELSQLGIAFDTLANRTKRRAYDEALGLIPEPKPRAAPSVISLRMTANFGGMGAASLAPQKPPAASPVREQPIERISAPEDRPKELTSDDAAVQPEAPIPEFLTAGSTPKRNARVRNQWVVNWKYPTFAFGTLILGAALVGAWAGAHAEDSGEKAAAPTMVVALPPAKGIPATREVPATSNSSGEPEFVSPAVIERARQRIRTKVSVNRRAGAPAPETPAADVGEAAAPEPGAVAAKLPLPNALIVRTIERIGYACGGVAAVAPIDGDEPGTYKVTCTSGQSYQARPVHGRYHFKRW